MLKRMNSLFKGTIEKMNRVTNQVIRLMLATIFLILVLFALSDASHAQTAVHDKSLKAYKLPANLKEHITEKHKYQIDEITSSLQETPRGPRGKLHLSGRIKPKKHEATSGGKDDHARAIAKAFLLEESELLGLPDLNELREQKISTKTGFNGEFTHIYYTRYIDGLPLEDSWLHIVIRADGTIGTMDASLVPVPSELYEAVANKTIPEEEARRIIEKDARTKNADIKRYKSGELKIYAIPSAPYAVWKGSVSLGSGKRWEYDVNAFTGEIINLRKMLIGERE